MTATLSDDLRKANEIIGMTARPYTSAAQIAAEWMEDKADSWKEWTDEKNRADRLQAEVDKLRAERDSWRRVAERLAHGALTTEAEVARLTAALAAEESRSGRMAEALKDETVVGWAYQDAQWADGGRWHLCSINSSKPREFEGRIVVPVVLSRSSTLKGSTDAQA